MGASVPKAFVGLGNQSLLGWALTHALSCSDVDHIVLVVPATHLAEAKMLVPEAEVSRVDVVTGGADRSASVVRGLQCLRDEDGIVLVHDAARPFAPPSLFAAVVAAVRQGHGAVVPGMQITDTVKEIDERYHVVATPDRAALRAIQTPQGFVREILQHAHASRASATDDAGLVEATGAPVLVIGGDRRAAKITTPEDLEHLRWVLAQAGRD